MSFDFHVAASFDEAAHSMRCFGVEYEVHERLFFRQPFDIGQYPILSRLRDYNADAVIGTSDLDAFLAELKATIRSVSDIECREFLKRLTETAEKAKSLGKNIYATCD